MGLKSGTTLGTWRQSPRRNCDADAEDVVRSADEGAAVGAAVWTGLGAVSRGGEDDGMGRKPCNVKWTRWAPTTNQNSLAAVVVV